MLARKESTDSRLRSCLDKIDFIPEDPPCSDSRHINALRDAEAIRYINPLNEVNEDMLIQGMIGASGLCANQTMLDLINIKLSVESEATKELVWANTSIKLPGLDQIPVSDLVSLRKNEEAFANWRDAVSSAMRGIQYASRSSSVSEKEMRDIFRESLSPVAQSIESKVKAASIKSALKSGAVSFGSSAAAALTVNPDPAVAVLTGGISSSLKLIYDLLQSKGKQAERSFLRMYSTLTEASTKSGK